MPTEAGWEIESVAEVLGVSVRSIEQWEENYTTHGSVKPPRLIRKCPRLLTPDMIDDIQVLLHEDALRRSRNDSHSTMTSPSQ